MAAYSHFNPWESYVDLAPAELDMRLYRNSKEPVIRDTNTSPYKPYTYKSDIQKECGAFLNNRNQVQGQLFGSLSNEVFSDARQREVAFLHSWGVILTKFSG